MEANMTFTSLDPNDQTGIFRMSALASSIVKEYYDSLLGTAQNDYMIDMFQSPKAIAEQLSHGYRYYFACDNGVEVGFMAFYPRGDSMYLSKLYLQKSSRGNGFAHSMIDFVKNEAKATGLNAIELNVNKNNISKYIYEHLGFRLIRDEKNDIGHGYFMDDYVYRLEW